MQIFNLPNLNENANTVVNYIIDDVQYTFHFEWCGDFAMCTAYFVANNDNIYLFKGKPITINTDLISRVKNPEIISGRLYVMNVYGQSVEPLQENFSKDYQLVYVTEDEISG